MNVENAVAFKDFAGERPVPLRVFFAYLYATWSLGAKDAFDSGGSRNPQIRDEARRQLMILCTSAPTLTSYSPGAVSYGYDEVERVLWFPRSAPCPGISRQFLRPERSFYAKHVRPFFNKHEREESFDLCSLDQIDQDNVAKIAATRIEKIANLGRVLIGAQEGGFFTIITIRESLDIDPAGVVALFSNLEQRTRPIFVELAQQERPNWWISKDAPPLPSAADTFGEFASDVTAALRIHSTLPLHDLHVITIPVFLADPQGDPSDGLALKLREHTTIGQSTTLVVAMNASASTVRAAVERAVATRLLPERVVAVPLGKEQLQHTILTYPWLWSKYVDLDKKLWIVHNDDAQLRRALLREPLSTIAGVDFTRVIHPRLQNLVLDERHIAITGRPGTGKSVALYQLARRMRDRLLVLIESGTTDPEIARFVIEVIKLSAVPVTLVLDNLQRQADIPALQTMLGQVLDGVERHGLNSRLELLTAHWNSHHEQICGQYGSFLTTFARPIDLDSTDRKFLVDVALIVLRSRAEPNSLQKDERVATSVAENFERWDARPASVVACLLDGYEGMGATVESARSFWALRFRQLDWAERGVIQILAALRWYEVAVLAVAEVRELYRLMDYPDERFDFTITRLIEKYWMRVERGAIECNDVQLDITDVGLLANNQFTEAARQFNRASMKLLRLNADLGLDRLEHIMMQQMNYRDEPQCVREVVRCYRKVLRYEQKWFGADPRDYHDPPLYMAFLGMDKDVTQYLDSLAGDEATRPQSYYISPAGVLAARGYEASAIKLLLHALSKTSNPDGFVRAAAGHSNFCSHTILSFARQCFERSWISKETLDAMDELVTPRK